MPRLNHKWEENKEFIPDWVAYRQFTCTRCGCIKTKKHFRTKDRKWFEENFERDGRCFDKVNPECIDWDDDTLD